MCIYNMDYLRNLTNGLSRRQFSCLKKVTVKLLDALVLSIDRLSSAAFSKFRDHAGWENLMISHFKRQFHLRD